MASSQEDATRRLAYLSGAARVSTRPEAGAVGPRAHVLGVIDAFRRLGWEVRPYIVGDSVPLSWVAGEATDRAMRSSPMKRVAADMIRLAIGAVHGPRSLRHVGQVDWVYERYAAFQALGWWFQRKGIPWILETNELCYLSATTDRKATALGPVLRYQERWAYRQCDVLVCNSQALADVIVERMAITTEKIVVLPNGVDTARMDPGKARPTRAFPGPTLGFVGQLEAWQRLDVLLDVLAELHQDGIDYHLAVVGDGSMREQWEAYAKSLGLGDRVRFVGRRPWDEVPDHIAGFDLGYLGYASTAPVRRVHTGSASTEVDDGPPEHETAAWLRSHLSPLKLYEYAAMGKPVIAAAYADAKRLLADGVPCYLFDPGNRQDLKRALRHAYQERDRWAEAGVRGRAVVVAKHSWEARVRELVACVETILKGKYGAFEAAGRRG